ncbi:ATP-binding protein [Patescibacteria group bacterium]|nr:ATP-binding protein [Patescibacteria group bacterium]
MMFLRDVETVVDDYLKSKENKVLFIWGPRRSGKTTLLNKIAKNKNLPIFNFDLFSDQEKFAPEQELLRKIVLEHKAILIDEVQNYPEVTTSLKILIDKYRLKIIATGSSELRRKSANFDSLAGRFVEAFCLPLSIEEIFNNQRVKKYEEAWFFNDLFKKMQIFGSYPEVFAPNIKEKEKIYLLQNILDTYVLKDIMTIYSLRNSKLAKDILTMIALQLGNEVSLREIANSLQANVTTVSNYIEIFIKNYILIPLPSFKTNLRKAVSENRKYYFYDLGIRNILIKDFRDLEVRPDKGALFENFVLSEIEKKIRNKNLLLNKYFYREYGGREVDLVLEDYKKRYRCYEIKYRKKAIKSVFPIEHTLKIIEPVNYFQTINEIG